MNLYFCEKLKLPLVITRSYGFDCSSCVGVFFPIIYCNNLFWIPRFFSNGSSAFIHAEGLEPVVSLCFLSQSRSGHLSSLITSLYSTRPCLSWTGFPLLFTFTTFANAIKGGRSNVSSKLNLGASSSPVGTVDPTKLVNAVLGSGAHCSERFSSFHVASGWNPVIGGQG